VFFRPWSKKHARKFDFGQKNWHNYSMLTRYLKSQIKKDIMRKMVFVGGPRQVGKTTLAKSFLNDKKIGYLNWDIPEDRERILKKEFYPTDFWIFDEIHKYKLWRNFLKGVYDSQQENDKHQILVTGSARLDYYYLRLHPLSLAELQAKTQKDLMDLLMFGGFPEPFFIASETETKRWSREYRNRLIREDLVQLERVHDLGNLELLALCLPALVGSPLSINALREDLQLSHKTVALWLQIL
jgi:predicted AAA+ superfamily ATPase